MHKLHNLRFVTIVSVLLTVLLFTTQAFAAKYPDLIVSIENCNVVITYEEPSNAFTSILITNNGTLLATIATGNAPTHELATVTFPITQYFDGEALLIELYNSQYDYNYTETILSVPDSLVAPCVAPVEGYCTYPLPVSAVQGRLDGATQAYYAPSEDARTEIVLPVGSSWWIAGAENGFYKLFVACQAQYLWVPASALGANFDTPWNGAALPTTGA